MKEESQTLGQLESESFSAKLIRLLIPQFVRLAFLSFDRKLDGAISFFFKHYGKSRFMVAMSKKVQYLGIERVWDKGPKAFAYFFLFYLIRDTILYIIIPIFFAQVTTD
jgi:hypothetical protein